jgi:hypothetical protein
MNLPPAPIHQLPAGYREVRTLIATEDRTLLWLNLAAIIPMLLMLIVMDWWWRTAQGLRGVFASPLLDHAPLLVSVAATVIAVALMFALHEWLHGLAIRWAGHRPRYGMKLREGVVYATADDALFPRDHFVVIALAPLVVMTGVGILLMPLVSDALAYYIGLMVVVNAGGAIGDLWMTWAVLRYPRHALVRDEADRIRIYMPAPGG